MCNVIKSESITAIATVSLAIIAYWQLHKANLISSVDFVNRLNKEFFTEKAYDICNCLADDLIEFRYKSEDFIIKTNKKRLKEMGFKTNILSTEDVDEVLLDHFEDVGYYEKRGIIKIDFVYESFSWYIDECGKSLGIRKYIINQRKEEGCEDLYDNFEYIYRKCENYGFTKNNHKSFYYGWFSSWKILWKFKWWFRYSICQNIFGIRWFPKWEEE